MFTDGEGEEMMMTMMMIVMMMMMMNSVMMVIRDAHLNIQGRYVDQCD